MKNSAKIIAVSEHTKRDILKNFVIDPSKIAVTYEGVEIIEKALPLKSETILKKYGIIKPYILYVGNAYPHKNLERLVLAFKEVSKTHSGLSLVLAGNEDYFYKRLKKFVADNNVSGVVFSGHIDEYHLPTIYREAKLYVFPQIQK